MESRSWSSLDGSFSLTSALSFSRDCSFLIFISCLFFLSVSLLCLQVSEVEVNGQIEAVCESMFSEMESQAVDALDLPVPGCFRMRSHSYVRAMDQGCSQDDDGPLVPASPPRTTTTVRTIQSSTGQPANTLSFCCYIYHLAAHSRTKGWAVYRKCIVCMYF